MKKSFKIEGLDCANCARKVEESIGKIKGVTGVAVSFLGERLTLEAEDEKFDEILKQAAKRVKKVEPDCRIVL